MMEWLSQLLHPSTLVLLIPILIILLAQQKLLHPGENLLNIQQTEQAVQPGMRLSNLK